jgi:hypothetical protein
MAAFRSPGSGRVGPGQTPAQVGRTFDQRHHRGPTAFNLLEVLILVTSLQSPSPAQQPPPDAGAQAKAVLPAVVAGDFARVEE